VKPQVEAMAVEVLYYQGYRIIHFVLEGVVDHDAQMEHVRTIARLVEASDRPILMLVDVKGFIPTKDYMDFASRESEAHKDKVAKSAFYNVDRSNRVLFELYDRFNTGIRKRKTFRDRAEALRWLVSDSPEA